MPEWDPPVELLTLLRERNAPVSFDSGRSIKHPCTFCGKAPAPGSCHELWHIGRYNDGKILTRPVCVTCEPVAAAHGGISDADERKDRADG